jgi:hypothetical protein
MSEKSETILKNLKLFRKNEGAHRVTAFGKNRYEKMSIRHSMLHGNGFHTTPVFNIEVEIEIGSCRIVFSSKRTSVSKQVQIHPLPARRLPKRAGALYPSKSDS